MKYVKATDFAKQDKDYQRAAIVYLIQKTPQRDGGFTDEKIEAFYKNNLTMPEWVD